MPSHSAVALLVLATLALAGCNAEPRESGPGEEPPANTTPTVIDAQPSQSCGARFAGPHGENARTLPALAADPESVVQRLGVMVDAMPEGAPAVEPTGALVWVTPNGTFRYERSGEPGDGRVRVTFTGPAVLREGPESRVLLQAALAGFHVDHDDGEFDTTRERNVSWHQMHRGVRIAGGAHLDETNGTTLVFGPLYQLDRSASYLAPGRAEEIAKDYAACVPRKVRDAGAAGLDVRQGSLTWVVRVALDEPAAEGCEQVLAVYVDAETGAVHGDKSLSCA